MRAAIVEFELFAAGVGDDCDGVDDGLPFKLPIIPNVWFNKLLLLLLLLLENLFCVIVVGEESADEADDEESVDLIEAVIIIILIKEDSFINI